jgi:hypothetical protein
MSRSQQDADDIKMPQNEDAEMAVLGCLLLHPETFTTYGSQIEADDFAHLPRYRIFSKMREMGAAPCALIAGAMHDTDHPEYGDYCYELLPMACFPSQVPVFLGALKLENVKRKRIYAAELVSIRGRDGDKEGMDAAIVQLNEIHEWMPPGEEVRFTSMTKLLTKSVKTREYLLEPVFTTRTMNEIFSWRGVGKTFFALGIAGAIASGGQFLGWKAPKARKVLFVDGELDEAELQSRGRALNIGFDNLDILCCDAQENPFPHLADPRSQHIIESRLQETAAEVLILDNLSALAPSDNISETPQWNVIQAWMKELKRKHGITTIFLHHAGHNLASRGTTRREDLLTTVIELRLPKDYKPGEGLRAELNFTKTRGKLSRFAESLEVRLNDFGGQLLWGFTELQDVRAAQILEMSNEGASVREIAKAKEMPSSTVGRLLQKAKAQAKSNK